MGTARTVMADQRTRPRKRGECRRDPHSPAVRPQARPSHWNGKRSHLPPQGEGAGGQRQGTPGVGLTDDSRAVLGVGFLRARSPEKKKKPSSFDGQKGLDAQAPSVPIRTRSRHRAGSRLKVLQADARRGSISVNEGSGQGGREPAGQRRKEFLPEPSQNTRKTQVTRQSRRPAPLETGDPGGAAGSGRSALCS